MHCEVVIGPSVHAFATCVHGHAEIQHQAHVENDASKSGQFFQLVRLVLPALLSPVRVGVPHVLYVTRPFRLQPEQITNHRLDLCIQVVEPFCQGWLVSVLQQLGEPLLKVAILFILEVREHNLLPLFEHFVRPEFLLKGGAVVSLQRLRHEKGGSVDVFRLTKQETHHEVYGVRT